MKYVPNGLSRAVHRTILKTQKKSPTILLAAGVVGVVGSAVLASKATLELSEVLEGAQKDQADAQRLHSQNRKDYPDDVYNKDILHIQLRTTKKIIRLYAPAVVLGAVSIGCLVQSHRVLSKRNAGLTAAYVGLQNSFDRYRERVADEFGEEKERDIRYAVTNEKVKLPDGTKVDAKVVSAGGEGATEYSFLWSRDTSSRWTKEPDYNQVFLATQQQFATDMLRSKGYIMLNDVLDMLKLPRTQAGQIVGWVYGFGGDDYVDFGFGSWPSTIDYARGSQDAVWLDFNVDGPVHHLIEQAAK